MAKKKRIGRPLGSRNEVVIVRDTEEEIEQDIRPDWRPYRIQVPDFEGGTYYAYARTNKDAVYAVSRQKLGIHVITTDQLPENLVTPTDLVKAMKELPKAELEKLFEAVLPKHR